MIEDQTESSSLSAIADRRAEAGEDLCVPLQPLPRAAGVYQIQCVPTGKIYIGSAVNLHLRWLGHKRRRRRGLHHNKHLQAAWEMYGEGSFMCIIVELVEDRTMLLATEQRWIDMTGCTHRRVGFNIFGEAGSPGAVSARIWEGFIDPDGNEVTITNLFAFCRTHDLDFPSMHRLAMGRSKLKSYKGWTHKKSLRKRDYVKTYDGFISPDGIPVSPITNRAAFCRQHNLEKSHMVAVAHFRPRSHKGWKYLHADERFGSPTVHHGFVSPEGEAIAITNLAAFCRDHGRSIVHMHNLKSGILKSHNGWTWSAENE